MFHAEGYLRKISTLSNWTRLTYFNSQASFAIGYLVCWSRARCRTQISTQRHHVVMATVGSLSHMEGWAEGVEFAVCFLSPVSRRRRARAYLLAESLCWIVLTNSTGTPAISATFLIEKSDCVNKFVTNLACSCSRASSPPLSKPTK